jgi:hypothetical protein
MALKVIPLDSTELKERINDRSSAYYIKYT